MRKLFVDQFEFDTPSSEESLEVMFSTPRVYPEFRTFLTACGRTPEQGERTSYWQWWWVAADHLRTYAGIELPHVSQWREIIEFSSQFELDRTAAFSAGDWLVFYHWESTA